MSDSRIALGEVLDGIAAAREAGLTPIKVNCVVQRGVNEDGLLDLVGFARREGLGLRCIEYMDVGATNGWRMADVVSGEEILERVRSVYPLLDEDPVKLVFDAVNGMVPKNRLGREIMGKLFVYAGPEHPHSAQTPTQYDNSAIRRA